MKFIIPIVGLLTVVTIFTDCSPNKGFTGNPCRPEEQRKVRKGFHHTMVFGYTENYRKKYNLSQTQLKKIEAINDAYRKQHHQLMQEHQPLRRELRLLLVSDKVDLVEVEKQLIKISVYDVKRQLYIIKQRIEIEDVLTKKQRIQMRKSRIFVSTPPMPGK